MTKETLKLFWRATWRYKWLLIGSFMAGTVWTLALEIFSPLVVSEVINRLSVGDPTALQFSDFKGLLIIFVALQVTYFVAGRIEMQTFIRLEPKAIRDLENKCFAKLQQHSLAFFTDNFSGGLVAKVSRLASAYQQFLDTAMFSFGDLVRQYIAALVVIFFLSPLIGGIFLGWTIVFCWSIIYMHKKKLHYSRTAAAAQTRVTARLADIITNTLTIRSFARSREEEKQFHKLTDERRRLSFRTQLIGDRIRVYKRLTMMILDLLVLWISIRLALDGALGVGSVVLIQFYLSKLLRQLWDFGKFIDRAEVAIADAAEMTEIIMQPHEVLDPDKPEEPKIKKGEITFKDVSFQYADNMQAGDLFHELNLQLAAGQKVGLVGPSGGGKTTLTKLLLRFMDIQSGEILIDGQNVAAIAQEDLRRSIAYVPQEPLLFHRTIYENIAYGNPKASKKQVLDAARKANADEFIHELPNQYDTAVGERGVKLSGGQRQRIAIARAMLKKAPVIVLDEATSSLDSVSEKYITSALDQLMAKRTTLVVAHRLSTIRKLDRILVMSEGKIVEDGTHQQLLKKKGLYATLWSHQSGDFLGEK